MFGKERDERVRRDELLPSQIPAIDCIFLVVHHKFLKNFKPDSKNYPPIVLIYDKHGCKQHIKLKLWI